jgi:hypothetical protein
MGGIDNRSPARSELHLDDGRRAAELEELLLGLAGETVHDDDDAEDAYCSALVGLGVMRRIGNRNFRLVSMNLLAPADVDVVLRYRGWLPGRYWEGE